MPRKGPRATRAVAQTRCVKIDCTNTIPHKGFTRLKTDSLPFHHRLYDAGWLFASPFGWLCPDDRDMQPKYGADKIT